MSFIAPDFAPAIPEIVVLGMACVILIFDLFISRRFRVVTYLLVQLTLIIAFLLSLSQINQPTILTFNHLFILDRIAIVFKLIIYISSFMAFLYSRHYVRDNKMPFGEYYILGLFSVLGMMIIVSAYNFLTLFLGLELFSLPVYAMLALRRNSPTCTEAAIKYFIISAIASGMLLYGFSMIYGATKTLDINVISHFINIASAQQQLIFIFGLVFVVVGIGFKLGAVPFHMWVPDVYAGAPTSVVLFIGTAPKIAALGLIFRLLAEAMPGLHLQWQELLIVLSILSMALGNLAAIAQTNIKRMLGYSSIAHMGYMLLGILTGTTLGYAAAVFYIIAYVIMALGALGLIVMMSQAGFEAEKIEDFRGLSQRNPWLAFMMLLLMFSFAGVPPIIGFMAKLAVLQALVNAHLVWLAALALLFAIIGAYYYIRVIKVMYFESPQVTTTIRCSADMKIAVSVNGLAVLLLGIFPGHLFMICQSCFA